MISQRVTVDLIVITSQRLYQLAEYKGATHDQLYYTSVWLLREWDRKIESPGLSVSLQTVVENAFLFTAQGGATLNIVRTAADQLMAFAELVQLRLLSEQSTQPVNADQIEALESAAEENTQSLEWFEAAKEITGARTNSTNASQSLREALKWLLSDQNPPKQSALRRLLNQAANAKNPAIPLAFVRLFKERYWCAFKVHRKARRIQQRTQSRKKPQKSA